MYNVLNFRLRNTTYRAPRPENVVLHEVKFSMSQITAEALTDISTS